MLAARVVLMHQGGWDEILFGLGPLLVIGVVILIARRQKSGDQENEE